MSNIQGDKYMEYLLFLAQKITKCDITFASYHAQAAGNSRRCNTSIYSEQYDINVKQDGSHNDHHIQIGTGKLHNSGEGHRMANLNSGKYLIKITLSLQKPN